MNASRPGEDGPEFWLRGPIPSIPPLLQPAAHALLQARADLHRAARGLAAREVWSRPRGVASIGFHLRHTAGSIDRLLTYAAGGVLTADQMAALRDEENPGDPPVAAGALLAGVDRAVDHALDVLRATPEATLGTPRAVGRAQLPSTVLGLLFHLAEHAQRHAGQAITTRKWIAESGGVTPTST
ncbi:MAG: DinB family protein [Gemmatimonadales bacterium]